MGGGGRCAYLPQAAKKFVTGRAEKATEGEGAAKGGVRTAPTNGLSNFPLLRKPLDVRNRIEEAVALHRPGEVEQARAVAEFEQKLDLVAADEERRLMPNEVVFTSMLPARNASSR